MASSLQGFEEVTLTDPAPEVRMTVTDSVVRFNKGTAEALDWPSHVKVLVNSRKKEIAVQVCDAGEPNAIKFSKPADKQTASVAVKEPKVLAAVLEYLPLSEAPEGEVAYQAIDGIVLNDAKAAVFAVEDAVAGTMKRRGRKKAA